MPPPEATVAVKVTTWPKRLGLADDVTVVVVGYGFTTWSSWVDVEGSKEALPR